MKINLIPEFHSTPAAKEYVVGQIENGGVLFVEFPADSASYKDSLGNNILQKLNQGKADDKDLEKFCDTPYVEGGQFAMYMDLFRYINRHNKDNHGKDDAKVMKIVPVDANSEDGWLMTEKHDLTVALARCKNDTIREEALKDLNEGRNHRLRLGIYDPYEAQEKRRTRYQTQQEKLKEYASELIEEIELRKQLKSLQEVEPNERYSLYENIDNEAQYNKLCGEYLREDFWEQKKNELDKNEFVGARDLIMADNIINSGVQGEPLLGIFGAAHIEGIKNNLEQDGRFEVSVTLPVRGNNLQDDKAYNFIAQETKIAKEQYQAVDITKYKDLESIKNKHSPEALEKLEKMLASPIDSPRFATTVDNNLSFGRPRGENVEGPNIATTVDNNLSFARARDENVHVPEVSLLKRFLRSKIKQIRRPIERGEEIATEKQGVAIPEQNMERDVSLSFGRPRGENVEGPNIATTVDNNLSFARARDENVHVPEVSLLKQFLRSKIKQIRRPIERGEEIATENQRTVVPKKKTKKVMEK